MVTGGTTKYPDSAHKQEPNDMDMCSCVTGSHHILSAAGVNTQPPAVAPISLLC